MIGDEDITAATTVLGLLLYVPLFWRLVLHIHVNRNANDGYFPARLFAMSQLLLFMLFGVTRAYRWVWRSWFNMIEPGSSYIPLLLSVIWIGAGAMSLWFYLLPARKHDDGDTFVPKLAWAWGIVGEDAAHPVSRHILARGTITLCGRAAEHRDTSSRHVADLMVCASCLATLVDE